MKFHRRIVLSLIALCFVALIALFFLAHTPFVARRVADWMERSTDGALRIGELSYELWRGKIFFRDVEWRSAALTAEVPEVDVELSLSGKHRVIVQSPRANWLGAASDGGGPISLPTLPPVSVTIADGTFFMDLLEVTSIEASFDEAGGTIRAERIAFSELEPLTAAAELSLGQNVVVFRELRVTGYGGAAEANGRLDLESDRQSFEVRVEDVELARIDERLSTRLRGTFSGELRGWDYRTLEGQGSVTLQPDPSGDIGLEVSGGTVRFEAPQMLVRGNAISATGEIGETIDARYRARLTELPEAVEGAILVQGTVSGSFEALRSDVTFDGENVRIEGIPLELRGSASWAEARVRLRDVMIAHESGATIRLEGEVADSLDLTGKAAYQNDPFGLTVEAALAITGEITKPSVRGSFEAAMGEGRFSGEGRFDPSTRRIELRGLGGGLAIAGVPEVKGTLDELSFDVAGTLDQPTVEMKGRLVDASYRNVRLPELSLSGHTDGKTLSIDGSPILTATIRLEDPYETEATISLEALPLTELARTLPQGAETEIRASGDARLAFPLTDLESVRYGIDATSALGVYRGIFFGASAPFFIDGNLEAFTVRELTLVGEDTAVGLEGVIPLSPAGRVDLDARGAVRLDLLNLWFPEAELAGRANASLHVEGILTEPEWNGDLEIDDARGKLGELEIAGGRLTIEGRRAPPDPVDIRFRAEGVVARTKAAEAELTFFGEVTSEDAQNLETLMGQGSLERVRIRGPELEIENDGPAQWRLESGTARIDGLRFGNLSLAAEARPFDESVEWSAQVDGTLDHALVNPFVSELGLTYSGTTSLSLTATGRGGEITLGGDGSWSGARLVLQDPPLVFSNVTGALSLDGSTIVLETLTADTGGGKVSASGNVVLSGASLANVDLTAQASSVRLSYPEGLRSELDGSIHLTGGGERLRLTGEVDLSRAVFSRDIDIQTELLHSIEDFTAVSEPDSLAESILLDIRVRAIEGLRIENNLARMETTANLSLGGTLGSPEVRGIVSAASEGSFRFGRNQYRIESGRIELDGYPTEPARIDIQARTSVSGYDIQLHVRGTTDDLITSLSAPDDPELSQADIASLLVTGRTLENVSSESRAILGEQMASYLGSTLGDLAEIGLANALPFQIVTVEPALIASETDPSARFTLGAALTDELTVVYSIGLDDAENQIWIVDYELPRRARTQLVRREDNEFSIGLTQKLIYDPGRRGRREERAVRASSVRVDYGGEEPPESHPEILRKLKPKPGDRYDYWKSWEESERIRKRLSQEGYPEATVDVVTTSCGPRCIDIVYKVDLGVPVAFLWTGDEVDDGLKRAVVASWNGRLGEGFVASDLVTVAEGGLFERGYYLAHVEASTQRTVHGVTVTVDFATGPRGKSVSVDFPGSTAVPESVLRTSLPKPTSADFYELLTTRRPRLKQLLELRYASFGYLSARIGEPERQFDERTGELRVTIPIVEGSLFRVDGLELEGVRSLEEATLRARIPLQDGAPFRPQDFGQSRAAIATYYRQQGFPDVSVTASLLQRDEPDRLGAHYTISEGARATVGNVTVAGNEATNEGVILREVALTPGEPIRVSEVNETQRRLYELRAFRSAEVVVSDPSPGEAERNVTVRVQEAPPLAFDYGARIATDGLFEVVTQVTSPNLFGRAHRVGFRTLLGTNQRTFRFGYHTPYFARYKLVTDFFVEREILEEPATEENPVAYIDRTWTFTAQQLKRITERLDVQWSYGFNRVATELDDPFLGPTTIVSNRGIVTTSLISDRRDNVVRPHRGRLTSTTFQASHPYGDSPIAPFVKLYTQLYTFVPVSRDIVWASGYRVGVANSFGENLIEEDRFQAGGPNSVRGFEQGSLGPVDDILQRPIGGAGLLVFNQEIRFPIAWRLSGAGFWDAGNAFEKASDLSLTDLRHSVGAGVRLELAFGLIRLDWARVVDRRPGEPASQFIFSLGHAF
ncbi:MAG TPA: translocation/assembly module TamB domain-containing protein [Vicinamibacteria bacterium]|nr:translocation/assembly module TamB domain-containing protein [Vicinamibacteria bacterium]